MKDFSRDSRVEEAGLQLGRARIMSEIGGAAPAWAKGVEQLESFIKINRDREIFSKLHSEISNYAAKIANGASQDAAQSANNGKAASGREYLATATTAGKILERYLEKSPDSEKQLNDLKQSLEKAELAIRRQETFDTAIGKVREAIESQNPAVALKARRNLLTRYSDFGDNKELKKLLAQTLETERSSIQREEVMRKASTEAGSRNQESYVALTPHSRSRSEEASQDRIVLALSKGACWGVDSITGRLQWRQVVGVDTPFFPLSISTSVPAVLLFDTRQKELFLVDRKSGALIWSQPIGEDVADAPLVHSGMIYLPTLNQHLYQISAETGEVTVRLKFSQKVLGPPVVEPGGQQMVLAGDEGILYRIKVPGMEPKSVTYLGHAAGSIEAPMMAMGALILVIERDQQQSTLLRVLDTRISDETLTQVATARVGGAVRDMPILRGKQLFVASSDERLAAFTVSDDANQQALSDGPRFQVPGSHDGPVYLSAGPNGQLWMSSSSLRRFQLKANNFELDTKQLAIGYSTQPVQSIGQEVYVGYKVPYSDALLFEQSDREEMVSRWRTVLGATVIAWGTSADGSKVCISETGAIFHLTQPAMADASYLQEAATQLKIESGSTTPLQGCSLGTNRMCAYIGGNKPTFWEINRIGRVDQVVELPAAIEARPTTLGKAIVLPLPQRLKLVGNIEGDKKIEDYQATAGPGVNSRWKFVVSLGDTYLLAIDDKNLLTSIQYRLEPQPHLAKVGERTLEAPVDFSPVGAQNKLFIADANGQIQAINASGLQTLKTVEMGAACSNDLWATETKLYAESGQTALHCVDITDEPKLAWKWDFPQTGSSLAGPPLEAGEQLIVAQKNGHVSFLNAANGKLQKEIQLDQNVSGGPQLIGETIYVPAIDGTLQKLE